MIVLKRIPGGRIGSFLAGAAVASVIGGTAVAITSPDFTYSATKQGYYTINAMALAPQGTSPGSHYTISYPRSLSSGSSAGCYQTGVNLPQDASVVSVTTWFRSGSLSNPSVYLYRQNLPTNGITVMVGVGILDNSDTREPVTYTVPASFRTVDNLYFSYGYAFCTGGEGSTFSGARINYTYKTAGD